VRLVMSRSGGAGRFSMEPSRKATGEQRWFCTEEPMATGGASSITLRGSPLARTDLLLGTPADHYV